LQAGLFVTCAVAIELLLPLESWSGIHRVTFWLGVGGRVALFVVLLRVFSRPGGVTSSGSEEAGAPAGPPGTESHGDTGMCDPTSLMASQLRHEVLSPLSAVFGFLELLREGKCGALSSQQQLYIEHMHDALQEALSVINAKVDSLTNRPTPQVE